MCFVNKEIKNVGLFLPIWSVRQSVYFFLKLHGNRISNNVGSIWYHPIFSICFSTYKSPDTKPFSLQLDWSLNFVQYLQVVMLICAQFNFNEVIMSFASLPFHRSCSVVVCCHLHYSESPGETLLTQGASLVSAGVHVWSRLCTHYISRRVEGCLVQQSLMVTCFCTTTKCTMVVAILFQIYLDNGDKLCM